MYLTLGVETTNRRSFSFTLYKKGRTHPRDASLETVITTAFTRLFTFKIQCVYDEH
jgi:hypothetical protein